MRSLFVCVICCIYSREADGTSAVHHGGCALALKNSAALFTRESNSSPTDPWHSLVLTHLLITRGYDCPSTQLYFFCVLFQQGIFCRHRKRGHEAGISYWPQKKYLPVTNQQAALSNARDGGKCRKSTALIFEHKQLREGAVEGTLRSSHPSSRLPFTR